ncbi:MAG: peptidoglycan bridge formation glycyltransferase FemA/FemB family protein [Clostridia bacterium]|nr:peptidoglycan bridge formation glycyltransferase FemA/FemB family protein [Clostridia bacterium]
MIEYLTLQNPRELDLFVASHTRGHYMQTAAYGKSRSDYHWSCVVLRNDNGEIYASIALLSRKIRMTPCRIFYAPRGPVFSNLSEFKEICTAARDYCHQQGGYLLRMDPPILENDPIYPHQIRNMGFHIDPRDDYSAYQPRHVYQLSLLGKSEDKLLASFHPKTRYNIRLASCRGLVVRDGNRRDLPIFHAMMRETAARDGFHPRPITFFDDLLTAMGSNASLLLAEKDGNVLAGAILIVLGNKAWYAFGCSFDAGRSNMPNHLLQWEMIRRARWFGCSLFDLRGVEGLPSPLNPAYGLHHFKQGFGAHFVSYLGQMDLPLRPGWYFFIQTLHRFL